MQKLIHWIKNAEGIVRKHVGKVNNKKTLLILIPSCLFVVLLLGLGIALHSEWGFHELLVSSKADGDAAFKKQDYLTAKKRYEEALGNASHIHLLITKTGEKDEMVAGIKKILSGPDLQKGLAGNFKYGDVWVTGPEYRNILAHKKLLAEAKELENQAKQSLSGTDLEQATAKYQQAIQQIETYDYLEQFSHKSEILASLESLNKSFRPVWFKQLLVEAKELADRATQSRIETDLEQAIVRYEEVVRQMETYGELAPYADKKEIGDALEAIRKSHRIAKFKNTLTDAKELERRAAQSLLRNDVGNAVARYREAGLQAETYAYLRPYDHDEDIGKGLRRLTAYDLRLQGDSSVKAGKYDEGLQLYHRAKEIISGEGIDNPDLNKVIEAGILRADDGRRNVEIARINELLTHAGWNIDYELYTKAQAMCTEAVNFIHNSTFRNEKQHLELEKKSNEIYADAERRLQSAKKLNHTAEAVEPRKTPEHEEAARKKESVEPPKAQKQLQQETARGKATQKTVPEVASLSKPEPSVEPKEQVRAKELRELDDLIKGATSFLGMNKNTEVRSFCEKALNIIAKSSFKNETDYTRREQSVRALLLQLKRN